MDRYIGGVRGKNKRGLEAYLRLIEVENLADAEQTVFIQKIRHLGLEAIAMPGVVAAFRDVGVEIGRGQAVVDPVHNRAKQAADDEDAQQHVDA